jgi:hypothetical protein
MANRPFSTLQETTTVDSNDYFEIVDGASNTYKKIKGTNVSGGVGGSSPKVYRALLTQTGTDAPVATVLENTLGGVPVWTREDVGRYVLTLNGCFTENKTFVNISSALVDITQPAGGIVQAERSTADTIRIFAWGYDAEIIKTDTATFFIQILVYP